MKLYSLKLKASEDAFKKLKRKIEKISLFKHLGNSTSKIKFAPIHQKNFLYITFSANTFEIIVKKLKIPIYSNRDNIYV